MVNATSQWQEPIAIVGMACRLPGGISNPQGLWDHVVQKCSSAEDVPQKRFNAESFLSMDPERPGKVAVSRGHFIDRDLQDFDHRFFGIHKDEAMSMDPQHKQLLEVVYECLESAGIPTADVKGANIGCYCGLFTSDYHDIQMRDPENLPTYMSIGTTRSMLANRISHVFDFRGPSITLDTACSTSLVALHIACQALHLRNCDGAIVGATNLFINPETALAMSRFGILAPDGLTMTFDADAHGYGRAEGINAIYIKRLSNALNDGDRIRGIIRATWTNSDGATSVITVPSHTAQAEGIRKAYSLAGIEDLDQTGYFECHGTGTPTGDPIEVSAVSSVFSSTRNSRDPLWIGSTKPNLGHSEAASGLTSLIKVVLALENKTIPPNINFHKPNPKSKGGPKASTMTESLTKVFSLVDFEGWKVRVPTSAQPWPRKCKQRASINSFGIGGSNAHVIIESQQEYQPLFDHGGPTVPERQKRTNHPYLIFVTGNSVQSWEMNISNLYKALQQPGYDTLPFCQLSQDINTRSQPQNRPYQSYFIVKSTKELLDAIQGYDYGRQLHQPKHKKPSLLFTFTGQGASWSQMGKRLMDRFVVAEKTLRRLDGVISGLFTDKDTRWSLVDKLVTQLSPTEIGSAKLAQPLCTAVQIALVDVLASWGVHPDGVVGHSSGEIAAAYACGAVDAIDAIKIAYYRGNVLDSAPDGGMMVVNCAADSKELRNTLNQTHVSIACINSPGNVTISGTTGGIQSAFAKLSDKGISCKVLPVTRAYHTGAMNGPASKYFDILKEFLRPKTAEVPMYSSTSGTKVDGNSLDARYWETNLRNPVQYSKAVSQALTSMSKLSAFVEIGPHRLLSRATQDIHQIHQDIDSSGVRPPYLSTMIRESDASYHLMKLAGELVILGANVDLRAVNGSASEGRHTSPSNKLLTNLPSYAWDYSSKTWSEPRQSSEWRLRQAPRHELLGSPIPGGNPLAPTWRNIISQRGLPWIIDHQINGVVTLPISAYVAMIVEALMQLREGYWQGNGKQSGLELKIENLILSRPIIFPDDSPVETFVTLSPSQETRSRVLSVDFKVVSTRHGITTSHCQGKASLINVDDLETTCRAQPLPHSDLPLAIPVKRFYKTLDRLGYGYGPKFRLLSEVRMRPGSTFCAATLKAPALEAPLYRYIVHPIVLDAALQTFFFSQSAGFYQEFQTMIIPSRINAISISVPFGDPFSSCVTHTQPARFGHVTGFIECFDTNAKPFMNIQGLQMDHVMSETNTLRPWIRLVWRPDIDGAMLNGIASGRSAMCNRSIRQGIQDLEDLVGKLIALIDNDEVQVNEISPPYMHLYRNWLSHRAKYHRTMKPEQKADSLGRLNASTIAQLVSETRCPDSADIQLAARLALNMKQIFAGHVDALAVMLEDDLLYRLYEKCLMVDSMNDKIRYMAELLAHKNPNMKILEIGAGTGGATDQVLRGLFQVGGRASYHSYTFTDISAWFFDKAKRKFANFERMKFEALDIEKSPAEQGFTTRYDLIVAANVLHATSEMENTMRNVRSMLKDGGHLLLAELSGDLLAPGFIMGGLPGWWLRSQDPTQSGPGLTHEEWKRLLSASGFCNPIKPSVLAKNTSSDDLDYTTVMVASAMPTMPPREVHVNSARVHVTGPGSSAQIQSSLKDKLSNQGINATFSGLAVLSRQPQPGEWLVLFDTVGDSILSSLQTRELEVLKLWLCEPINCLWITRNVHLNPHNAPGGLVTGFARTLRQENCRLQLYTLDFSSSDSDTIVSVINHVISKVSKFENGSILALDYELAEKDGQLWTCRLEPDPRSQKAFGSAWEMDLAVSDIMQSPYSLTVREPGVLDSLIFALDDDPRAAMTSQDLLIDVKAVGLDTEDVKAFSGLSENRFFGCEFGGIVKQCGSNTSGFHPGNYVIGVAEGTFKTQLLASSVCCRKVPSIIPFEVVCGVHPDFLHHGLRVLILGGSTSLGIAAMQLAILFGAEVATIIPDEKYKHLPEKCGIASDKIFVIPDKPISPHEDDFIKSERYSIIIDTVSHKAKSYVGLLVPGGTYIGIGRSKTNKEFMGGMTLPSNITFINIDIMDLYRHNKQHLGRILDQVIGYFETEELKEIIPLAITEVQDLKSAFSAMSNGSYEKQVIKLSSSDSHSVVKMKPNPHRLNQDKTYVIAGGLGGLGREISVWLASRGARNIVLLTSSPTRVVGSDDLLQELAAYGCKARVDVCDIAELADVSRVVTALESPVGGIVHAALRLSDRAFTNMTVDDFKTVLDPKLQGCMNLHKAFRNENLDFFVMLSSGCGIIGNPGQANYSASSTFLDSFARYRHHLGLPAASIDLGYVEEIGYVSANPSIEASLLATGIKPISFKEVVEILEAAILSKPPTLNDLDLSDSLPHDPYTHSQFIIGFAFLDKATTASQTWTKDKKFDPLRSMDIEIGSSSAVPNQAECAIQTATKAFHDAIHRGQGETRSGKSEGVLQPIICSVLVAKLAQVLSVDVSDIGTMQSAAEYGIDSLMATEVRSWARMVLSVDLPVNELMSPYSIQDLAAKIARKLWQT